ncbi:hypothetical protein KA068_01905 [Candidatus Saccharibacteria bacterium]|jgi:hypothetical protein|nr:hypothetical protein [Candidatus Saccharibacteria bacterium]
MTFENIQIFKGRLTRLVLKSVLFLTIFGLSTVLLALFSIFEKGGNDEYAWRFICSILAVIMFTLLYITTCMKAYWVLYEKFLIVKFPFRRKIKIPYEDIVAIVYCPVVAAVPGRPIWYEIRRSTLCFKGKGKVEYAARKYLTDKLRSQNLRSVPFALDYFETSLFIELKKKLKNNDIYIDGDSKYIASEVASSSDSLSKVRDTASKVLRNSGWLICIILFLLSLFAGMKVLNIQQEDKKTNTILVNLAKKHVEIPDGKEIESVFCNFINDQPTPCGVYLKGSTYEFTYFFAQNRGNGNYQFVPLDQGHSL